MTRLDLLALALFAGLALGAAPALSQDEAGNAATQQGAPVPGPPPSGPVSTARVGFLDLRDDARYHPRIAYTRIQISPALHPVEHSLPLRRVHE